MNKIHLTQMELRAIAHCIGNALCQLDPPYKYVLEVIREKIRAELQKTAHPIFFEGEK